MDAIPFTNPFRYIPHPLVREAAEAVIREIDGSEELSSMFVEGKMMGVLIARDRKGNLLTLKGFSGAVGGKASIDGFVPPIFDLTCPGGYYREKEAEISGINSQTASIIKDILTPAAASLKALQECRDEELASLREKKKEGKKPSKWDKIFEAMLMPIATVLAVVLAVGLFFYLPMQLWKWITAGVPVIADNYFLRAFFEGILRIIVFVGYVWATSLMKDIRRTYMYHGAEHKTIFCYEAELPLTVENVRKQSRLHPRCGTSFLILVLIVGIVVGMFIRIDFMPLRMLVKLATFPIVIGCGYELIKLAGRRDNWFTRMISAPGKALQKITTREPDDEMIECAIAAMKLVIPDDNSDAW